MRVLFVLRTIHPDYGGPLEGTREIASALCRLGHSAEVAHLDAPPTQSDFDVPVHALGPSLGAYGYTPRLAPWIRLHASRFDAVVVNGLWHYPGLGVALGLRGTRTPYFVFTHGSLHPWFRQWGLKEIQRTLYWKALESRVVRRARALLFTSEEERELARDAYQPFPTDLRVVSYCAAEPPANLPALKEQFLNSYPQLRNRRVVLFLGRIHPVKGCDLLISAFAEAAAAHPDLHLVIAGPDPTGLVPHLQAQARALGIAPSVLFTGALHHGHKWAAYAAASLFVLPSHAECFGVSLAAALAAGVPAAISHGVNTWREIAGDGAAFAAPATPAGIAALLRDWLAAGPDRLDIMRQYARTAYLNRYAPHIAAAAIVRVLEG